MLGPSNLLRCAGVGLLLVLGALGATRSHAEIERIANPTQRGFEMLWWPKVSPPANWIHDRETSYANHINLFVLEGEDFGDSPAVLYARAIFHEHGTTDESLEKAIQADLAGFHEHSPDSSAEEVAAVQTGDGKSLRTFSFSPKAQGHWELVAYGREPEFVLMFCISATSKEALEKHRAAFLTMVRSYTSRDEH